MTQDEWLTRFKRRFIEVAGITEAHAEDCARSEPFDALCEMFEDDPEGAADEEMSYWTD